MVRRNPAGNESKAGEKVVLRNCFVLNEQVSRYSPASTDLIGNDDGEDGFLHVVSWMDCLDLRLLAVLANSTLASSRFVGVRFRNCIECVCYELLQ